MKNKRPNRELASLHVMICVPSGDMWESSFGTSLLGLVTNFTKYPVDWVKRIRLSHNCVKSSMLAHNREVLVRNALTNDATHVLFLDDDMVFPKDTLSHLLRWRRPFVAAQGVTKQIPADPVAVSVESTRVYHGKEDRGLVEVKHVGLAVALIETEWLKEMSAPLFEMPYQEEAKAPCGEDVYFCRKWKEETGQPIYIDVGLSGQIGHVGKYVYSMEDVEPPRGSVGRKFTSFSNMMKATQNA